MATQTRATSRVLDRFTHLDELYKRREKESRVENPADRAKSSAVKWHTESAVTAVAARLNAENGHLVLAKVMDDPLMSSSSSFQSTVSPEPKSNPSSSPRGRLWAAINQHVLQRSPRHERAHEHDARRRPWPKSPGSWYRPSVPSVAGLVRNSPLARLGRRGGARGSTEGSPAVPAASAAAEKRTRWAAAVASVKKTPVTGAVEDTATDSSQSTSSVSSAKSSAASSMGCQDSLDGFMQSSWDSSRVVSTAAGSVSMPQPWDPSKDALDGFIARVGSKV